MAEGPQQISGISPVGGDDLRGFGGRVGVVIGDEIADGAIHFVADAGDDGDAGSGDGAGDDFFVEGPEVFQRPPAAGEEDDVEIAACD